MSALSIHRKKGFTLIEILIVIALIAVLAGIVIVALNPARQFASARNTQRSSNVNAILNAIGQNMADNRGVFTCASGVIPAVATVMRSSAGGYNIYPCIVPTYIAQIVFDPSAAGAHFTSASDYDTAYTVLQDVNGRVTVAAPSAELAQVISVQR